MNYNLSIKNIRLYPSIQQFPPINSTKPTYLYVSDTGNHCIKKIDIKNMVRVFKNLF